MNTRQKQALFIVSVVVAGFMARLLPHAANFVPVTALALLAAAYLPRRAALAVPLAIMVLSDLVIGLHPLIAYTWGSFVLIGFIGAAVYKKTQNRWYVAGLGPVGAGVFFVVTNFGVWLQGGMYSHTWAGLAHCFTMALPFFRSTLLSDMVYTPVLFLITFLVLKSMHAAAPKLETHTHTI